MIYIHLTKDQNVLEKKRIHEKMGNKMFEHDLCIFTMNVNKMWYFVFSSYFCHFVLIKVSIIQIWLANNKNQNIRSAFDQEFKLNEIKKKNKSFQSKIRKWKRNIATPFEIG